MSWSCSVDLLRKYQNVIFLRQWDELDLLKKTVIIHWITKKNVLSLTTKLTKKACASDAKECYKLLKNKNKRLIKRPK